MRPAATTTRALLDLIEREQIVLLYDDLSLVGRGRRRVWGMHVQARWQGSRVPRSIIVLDKHLEGRPALYRTVLAEEIGHHFAVGWQDVRAATGPAALELGREESRAVRWAADFLLPRGAVRARLAAGATPAELADEFIVTEWLAAQQVRFLRWKGDERGHGAHRPAVEGFLHGHR